MHSTYNLEKSSIFFFFLIVAYRVNCYNKFAGYYRSLLSSLNSPFSLFYYGEDELLMVTLLMVGKVSSDQVYSSILKLLTFLFRHL